MKTIARTLCTVALAAAGNALAEDAAPMSDASPIGWYVAPMYSYTRVDGERRADNGTGGLLALGHRGDNAAIELAAVYSRLGPSGGTLTGGELAVLIGAPFEQEWLSRFFGVLGLGVLEEKDIPALQDKSSTSIIGEAGLGYMQPFRLFGFRMDLRAEARARYDYVSPPHNSAPSHFQEVVYNVGLQFPLSGEPEPLPAPKSEEISIVAPVSEPPPPVVEAPAVLPPVEDRPVTLETAKAGDIVVLSGVNFEFNQATLTANAKTILNTVAKQLLARDELRVEIGGHTDSRGKDAYNQKLSERRAQSVLTYLTGQGMGIDRMTAVGYGEAQPVDTNDTEEGREHNRRVAMKILE